LLAADDERERIGGSLVAQRQQSVAMSQLSRMPAQVGAV
jgi:hypothetical protein